jgi:hypothetical protein
MWRQPARREEAERRAIPMGAGVDEVVAKVLPEQRWQRDTRIFGGGQGGGMQSAGTGHKRRCGALLDDRANGWATGNGGQAQSFS